MILEGADADDEDGKKKSASSDSESDEMDKINKGEGGGAGPANVNKQSMTSFELEDVKARYEKGTYKLIIDSITPRGGPTYGATRVTVRAEGIAALVEAYPEPRCKFGSNNKIVEADYVKCSTRPSGYYDKEKGAGTKSDTCI